MNGKTKVRMKKAARHVGITFTLGTTFGLGMLVHGVWLASAIASQVEANTEMIREELKPEVAILRDAMVEQKVVNENIIKDLKWMKDHWPTP